jgi:ethanolamine phosphate phosphodiesterase
MDNFRDEGSIVDEDSFNLHKKRFDKIFKTPTNIKSIFIPGDNDIGGEGSEPVKYDKVERFNSNFGNESMWSYGSEFDVMSVNLITRKYNSYNLASNFNKIRILISHYPVLTHYLSKQVINEFQPMFVFSAHDHETKISALNRQDQTISFPTLLTTQQIFDIDCLKENQKIIEISVHPLSYRMGTLTIGFSQAIFDDKKLFYSPIFVLSRFYQLLIYILTFIFLILFKFFYCKRRLEKQKIYNF